MKRKNTAQAELVVIDGQEDFMDSPTAALGVPGARKDMEKVAGIITRYGDKLNIHATLDSHHELDLGHPWMWVDGKGNHPPVTQASPVFPIFDAQIQSGEWKPRNGHLKPGVLGGLTIDEYFRAYSAALVKKGQTPIQVGNHTITPISYPVMVYNPHCLIGTAGAAVYGPLRQAFGEWERSQFANVNYLTKGDCPWAECYGGLIAETPLAGDQSTQLQINFLKLLQTGNDILITGEALSHCVLATLLQIVEHIGVQYLKKIVVFTDCSSCIPKVGDSSFTDFPVLTANKLKELELLGVTCMTSEEYFG